MSDKTATTTRLQKIAADSIGHIISTLANIARSDDQPLVARAIVLSFVDKKCSDLLKCSFKLRIDAADSLEEMFAQNSLSKCVIQDVILLVAKSYVKDTLGPSLKKFLALKKNLSPDPRTNAMSEETRTKLGEIIKECVSDLLKSAPTMPMELKRILVFAKKKLDRKWPVDVNGNGRPLVNFVAFLFAHIVIPATAQPQIWGISKETHSSDSGRTSIVLNKVFRNIASGTPFDSTSPLSAYNVSIKKLQPKLEEFAESILKEVADLETSMASAASSTSPTTGTGTVSVLPPLRPVDPQPIEVSNTAFQVLHHCMYLWKDAIMEYRNSLNGVAVGEARIFFDLIGNLEELELSEGKPECPADLTILSLDKTTKPPSKATMRKPTPSAVSGATPKSAIAANTKPYVRQLSEKWNREHQQMVVEAKKREQAAEQRKADRESQIRGKSTSMAPAVAKSNPGSPVKPKGRASVSEEASSGRQIMKRSFTSEPAQTSDIPTIPEQPDSPHSSALQSSSSSNPLSPRAVPSPADANPDIVPPSSFSPSLSSPSSPKSSSTNSKTPEVTANSGDHEKSTKTGKTSISPQSATSDTEDDTSGSKPSSAANSPAIGRSSTKDKMEKSASNSNLESDAVGHSVDSSASLSTSSSKLSSSGSTEKGTTSDKSPSSRAARIANRKSKKLPTVSSAAAGVMSEGESTNSKGSGGDISSSELLSPASKRRRKADSRSSSTAVVIESPKTKQRRKPKESMSDDESLSAGASVPKARESETSSSSSSTMRVHREVVPLEISDVGDSTNSGDKPLSGGAGSSRTTPKLTIMSMHPNPTLNVLENTPVTPRTADFLRDRSNSMSEGRFSPPKVKKEKALEMLGLQGPAGSSPDVGPNAGLASVVRELGVANAKLQRDLEASAAKAAQLENDIVRLRELHETRANRISDFHAKLTSSVLYRRSKATHLRRLTLHAKRTWNPSIDDNLWDYQSATQHDRRAVLASTIFSRIQESQSTNNTSRSGSGSSKGSRQAAPRPSSSRKPAHNSTSTTHTLRATLDAPLIQSTESDSDSPNSRSGSVVASLDRSAGLLSSETH
jgi:mRNA-degrading endonuclease HigB of HigAB toxin-antitoxin module